ncbi:quaternary amine ABC transporter ATP-binding protein [Georgenia sp. Z1491]|uniref:quaternary amine ABC transporter ATP-binding protein n=1 Tax=Georgenia sp. Z1491 TaxID=3416707 RepID=UPI003CF7E39B
MVALSARNVYKVFGRQGRRAVERLENGASRDEIKHLGTAAVIDASFDVDPGEIFVVMGLSGSGKSTLIRTLNGLHPATTGSIEIGGTDIAKASGSELRAIRRKKVSMVFQHFALLPHRTVLDNAAYGLEIQGVGRSERLERAREVVELTGLGGWQDSVPAQLSGGMQQRVGLARALASDTEILLMDEAFSALDPLIRREMQDQLVELQTRLGKTIVFITHDLNEAVRLGDRIAVMRDGRIVQIDTGEKILSDPADEYVARFIADVDRSRVITAGSVMTRPATTVWENYGPGEALRTLRDSQVSAAYVIDRRQRLVGSVYDEELLEAQRRREDRIGPYIHPDTSAVNVDTPISEVFAPAAEARLAVPVTDDEDRLLGVVPRVALLEAMVPSELEDAGGSVEDLSPPDEAGDDAGGAHAATGGAHAATTDAATTTTTETETR